MKYQIPCFTIKETLLMDKMPDYWLLVSLDRQDVLARMESNNFYNPNLKFGNSEITKIVA